MDASAVKLLIAQLVGVVACGGVCFLSWQVKQMWKLLSEMADAMQRTTVVMEHMDKRIDGVEFRLDLVEKEVGREDS